MDDKKHRSDKEASKTVVITGRRRFMKTVGGCAAGSLAVCSSASAAPTKGLDPLSAQNPHSDEFGTGITVSANTVATFQAQYFPAHVQTVNIRGYRAIGTGSLWVRRVASQPTHLWKFRSRDRFTAADALDNSNGGWWEGYAADGSSIHVAQFGATMDGVTDDLSAFNAALDYIDKHSSAPGRAYSSYILRTGPGTSYISDTLTIPVVMTIMGCGGGGRIFNSPSSILKWPANKTGIIIPDLGKCDGCRIQGLAIYGDSAYVYDNPPDCDGIQAHRVCIIEDVWVSYFPRDGINLADNQNDWFVSACRLFGNGRDGLHIRSSSGNSNAGIAVGVSCLRNGEYGIRDLSYFVNTYTGGECDGNAGGATGYVTNFNKSMFVLEAGTQYQLIPTADPANSQALRPSTHPTIWRAVATGQVEGSTLPKWGRVLHNNVLYDVVVGQEANMWTTEPQKDSGTVWTNAGAPVGGRSYIRWVARSTWSPSYTPYTRGGSVYTTNAAVFLGFYTEGNQAGAYLGQGVCAWGGLWGSGIDATSPGYIVGVNSGLINTKGIQTSNTDSSTNTYNVTVGGGLGYESSYLQFHSAVVDTGIGSMTLKAFPGVMNLMASDGNTRIIQFSGNQSMFTLNRSAAVQFATFIPQLFVGSPDAATARLLTAQTAAPTRGVYGAGDIVLNSSAVVGGVLGWRCVASGTPGIWEPIFGASKPYVQKTASYSIVAATDYTVDCTAKSFTVTLPTAVGLLGRRFEIINSGTGTITIAATSSQTINGQSNQQLAAQYTSMTVVSDGANWKIV